MIFSYISLWFALLLPFIDCLGQQPLVSFEQCGGCVDFTNPNILVDAGDWPGVQRAAGDLATDFGRVTGRNASVITQPSGPYANPRNNTNGTTILVGTLGKSSLIDTLVKNGALNVSQISGQWEAFQTQLVTQGNISNPLLVIAGNDKRGSIYGLYDISEQIGVSPFHFWADVSPQPQSSIYITNQPKVQKSPDVRFRGLFINDESPSMTGWVIENFPDTPYGPGFNHNFWSLVFEMILRLRGNYLWPTTWNSMFYEDDPLDPIVADMYGIVMGTSHTEPMTRQTKEQELFLPGPWDWSSNEANITEFFAEGANRSKTYETVSFKQSPFLRSAISLCFLRNNRSSETSR